MLMISTNLRRYREELTPKVSQEKIARQAGLSLQWYRQIETIAEQPTSYTTAQNILKAINTARKERQLSALTLEDLNLTIV